MVTFEEEILECLIKKPWLWWRYIHDIIMIWHHGENELQEFIDKINKSYPAINYSRERVHFLEVQVIFKNNEISTDFYVKETDSHQYLHPLWCHQYH